MKKAIIPILIVLILGVWGGITYLLLTPTRTSAGPSLPTLYAEYQSALIRRDFNSLKSLLTKDNHTKLLTQLAQGKLDPPLNVTVKDPVVSETNAILSLTANVAGKPVTSKAYYVKIGPDWLLNEEEPWTLDETAEAPTATVAASNELAATTSSNTTGVATQALVEASTNVGATADDTNNAAVASDTDEAITNEVADVVDEPVSTESSTDTDEVTSSNPLITDDHNMQPGVSVYKPKPKPKIKASASIAFRRRSNWVINPSGDDGTSNWVASTEAQVTSTDRDSNPFFALYNKDAIFHQDISLTGQEERVILVIARTYSERINPPGDITGYPQIAGDWLTLTKPPARIIGHMKDDSLTFTPKQANQWGVAMGVFTIPKKATHLRLYLRQAAGPTTRPASLTGFDDVSVYFFPDTQLARQLAAKFAIAATSIPR